ncbi:MAG: TRAP transporter large permease [Candidatus Lambdaproteobacteria bacterium]|nr:TRAP transporter large permease [Candidatus Lambdaproteobacteria bacterium]
MVGFSAAVVFMLAMMLGGVWVVVSIGAAGIVGLFNILGFERVVVALGSITWETNTNFVLVALPLFVFMGELLFQTGIMNRIYVSASKIVSGLPGGLLQTNIAACTLFAACSGSSLASAATIGSVGYPQIVPRGYDRPLALGSIAAGGTLGILIPPSIIFIIYGSMAEVSIGRLFMAGVLPGLLLATLYVLYIAARALLNPALAPREPNVGWRDMLKAVGELWQVILLAAVVLGGIYGGVASPTEVAALGAVLALVFAAVARTLTWRAVRASALNTVRQTCMILFIIMAAKLFAMTLIYYQIPNRMVGWIEMLGLSAMLLVVAVCLLYLAMGTFFDGVSMMVITIPFVVPMMLALQVDLIWLGVLVCIMIEIGLLTPPVGLNIYVLQGATGESMRDIVVGSMPFVLCQVLTALLVLFYPQLALFLPSLLF